jgi:hypothetical protein
VPRRWGVWSEDSALHTLGGGPREEKSYSNAGREEKRREEYSNLVKDPPL